LGLSVNTTKIRLTAGSNGIAWLTVTNIAKVGVAFGLICVVTVGPTLDMHAAVTGLVWHSKSVSGSTALPVLADTVMMSPIPRFTVATANAVAERFGGRGPKRLTMPLWLLVTASATMSGVGTGEAESRIVPHPVSWTLSEDRMTIAVLASVRDSPSRGGADGHAREEGMSSTAGP
jgi:hypothetical protein